MNVKLINNHILLSEAVQNEWSSQPLENRKQVLLNVASKLRKEKTEIAKLITAEMGKIITESEAEIEKCALLIDYYIENCDKFSQIKHIKTQAKESYVIPQSLGVLLAIMPWNFPFWQVFRFIVPNLLAGNSVLLKHASNVTKCAKKIEEILLQSSAPLGLFQTIIIDAQHVHKIIKHPLVKGVTLTGSEYAGSQVAKVAGKYIKKTVLELGGSDAFIVLNDADLELSVTNALISRFLNCGQSCIAAKRFIVHKDVYDLFLEKLKNKIQTLKKGSPFEYETQIGPMARKDLAVELQQQVDKSVKMGAHIELGGKRKGAFFEPTILTNVTNKMPAYHEELFGPVAVVFSFKNIEEAIHLTNDTKFGLGCSIWTTNVELAKQMSVDIEVGSVFINSMVKSDPRLPFGGVKFSGYGRELSEYGFNEFINFKTVVVN